MEVTQKDARLILASGSPRRRELLALLEIPFTVEPSRAEENATGTGKERVAALARLKCEEVVRRIPTLPILAADTLVCAGDEVLGKPVDEQDARRMLRRLSGVWHEVHTGVCLHMPDGRWLERVETTRVKFCALDDGQIARYVQTGEPMDKAGAYAIQERAGAFVQQIDGSPSNVIGLPLCTVDQMLREAGLTD